MNKGESKMMKIKTGKSCGMMILSFIILFSFALSSCPNPFIIDIVEPRTAAFNSNGGSSVESQTVFKDQPIIRPSDPSKIDHTFAAWYRDNNTFEQEWDFNAIPNADITLYAKWIADKAVTNIAIKTPPKVSYAHGETLDLSGLVVTLTYDDDTTADVAYNAFASRGITVSMAHGKALSRSTDNGLSVTVTYGSLTQTVGNLIVSAKVTPLTVEQIQAQPYTGSAITPTVTVKDGATTLTLTTDYTVSYTDNTNVGTATVNINGAGNYAGSTGSATFVISNAFITSAAITIPPPVKGETPSTTASGSGNFTVGTVSWNPSHSPFAGSTVYTATVTLTANTNYAFATLAGANATINGINALVPNNTGNTVTLSRTFAATDAKTVTGISIKTNPTKLTYTHDEALNLTGLVVTLTHDDSTTEDVILSAFGSKNITTNPVDGTQLSHTAHNGNPVTVTYGSLTANTTNLTVDKANPAVTWPTGLTANYGQTLSNISLASYTNGGTGSFSWTTPTASVGSVGTQPHNMTFTPTDTTNYNTVTNTVNITVGKINPTVTWPTGLTATYGQTLSNISLASFTNTGGTAGSFSWTTSTDSVGIVGTRSHSMTFTPTDTANYSTITQNVNITVNKADPTVTWPTGLTATYGQTLSNITLPGNTGGTAGSFSWTAGGATSVGNAGTQSHNMTFTPTNTANYNTAANNVSITVNKANPTVSWPSGLTATYGQTLSNIPLASYTNTGGTAGSFSWDTPTDSVGNVGTRSHSMTFTPTSTANYNTAAQNVNITVGKAAGATVSSPTATAENIGVTSVTLNAMNIPDQDVEYARNDSNTAPTSGWQTGVTFSGLTGGTQYYFFARSKADDNFSAGTPSAGTLVTTLQNIGINITLNQDELTDPTLNGILDKGTTIYKTGSPQTANITITGVSTINWVIRGVGAYASQSVSGSTTSITLDATNTIYNSPGYHVVEITFTVNNGIQHQLNFRFRIVE